MICVHTVQVNSSRPHIVDAIKKRASLPLLGYVKDLADLLMNSMNLTYTLQLVNDSKYGAEDPKAPFGW